MFAGGTDEVTVSLTAVDNVTPVLRTVAQSMGVFAGSATQMGYSLAQLGAVALPIMAIGGAFIYAGQQAQMVQQNVANLNAVLHATGDQLAAIRNNGLALSQATQFTDAQILASQRQLAKGGASADALAQSGGQGVTGATLNLAAATQSDATAAATSMTTASSAYQIPVQEAAKTATTLASAVDSSVGSLASQASALKQVGVVAKAAGFDLKETVTTIADLQNNGMMNDSGTGLKTFLARIEAPSATAKQQIDALGLSFYDLQGHLKPIPELFDEIHTKMIGLDQQTANDALTKIFGLRGVRVADIALEQGSSGFVETAQSMAEKGDASEIAARKLNSFQGSASKAASSLNTLAVQFGTVLLPGMKDFADITEQGANALSRLNNAATVVPQVAVGVAAIAGIAKFGSIVDNRQETKQTAAQGAIDGANQARIAAAADYSHAVAAAEFEADTKIAAAHADLDSKLTALDGQRYETWMALQNKSADEAIASEAKQLASLQTITERTLAAIAQIDKAQQAAAEAESVRATAQAEKQRALLTVNQGEQTAKFAVQNQGFGSPTTVMAQQQQIERDALDKRIAIEEEYQGKVAQIRDAGYAAQREQAIAAGAQSVAAAEREATGRTAAISAGLDREEAALAASFAKQEAMAKAAATAQVAAADATAMGKLGSGVNYLSVGGVNKVPNQALVAGSISDEAKAIKVPANVTLTAGTVAADAGMAAGLLASAKGIVTKIAGGLGELLLPLTLVAVAKPLIIDPLLQKITDQFKNGELPKIAVGVNDIIKVTDDKGASPLSFYQDELTKLTDLRDKAQAIVSNYKDPGAGGVVVGGIFKDHANEQDYKTALAQIDQIDAARGKITNQIDILPAAALSKSSDTLATLIGKVDDGTLSVADFTAAWATAGKEVGEDTVSQLERQGVAQDKANQTVQAGIDLAKQHAKALDDARQQAQADYTSNANDAMAVLALGATPDLSAVAAFGKHTDQTDATKVEIANAKKEVAELKTAWTEAQTVINGIDITKGFDAFAKLADSIALANRELANVGQSNAALQDLGRYADLFKQVTDAETAASAAMNGYNLTLDQSQSAMNKLTGVQKEFETALMEAERRQAAGQATSADSELIANKGNIRGNLANQQDTLSQHMVLDVLGTVKNLPDFAALDTYVRDVIDKAGGGISVVATITSDATTARQQMESILKPPITVMVVPDFSQFSPAILNAVTSKTYAAAVEGGTYNDTGGGPPGGPPGGGAAAASQYASYTQYPGNSNPLTYHDLSSAQYAAIVAQSTGGKSSPFDSPDVRDQLLAAAKEANVDPRLMLDTTRYENNDATNISAQMLGIHNYGGIKYDPNNPNEARGPRSPEGDSYAAFDSAKDFFKTLAANLSTGEYASDFAQGNSSGIRQRYVAGNAPPSADQSSNIMNWNNTYWDWVQKFPANSGNAGGSGLGAGGGQYSQSAIASSEHLTAAQSMAQQGDVTTSSSVSAATATGFDPQSVLLAAKQHLGEITQIDNEPWYMWCEKFVDNAVQEATGLNYRAGTADAHVRAAEAGSPGAGQVIDRSQARPGDLVGWEGSGGGAMQDGHIGVFAGGNQYIGTTDNGIQVRDLMPGAVFIRPDGVVASGPVPGAIAYNKNSASNGPGTGTINAELPPSQAPLPTLIQPTAAQSASFAGYGTAMNRLDAQGQGSVEALLAKITPAFTSLAAEKAGFGYNRTSDPNAVEKQQFDNAGLSDAYTLATKYGAAIEAVNNRLPVTAQMYKDINAAAGPLGGLIEGQARATVALTEETQKLSDLKQAQQEADTAHQTAVQQRQTFETNEANKHTVIGIDEQMAQRQTTAARLVISRQEQDEDVARQRKQTLDQRSIDDSRTAQQRSWQDEDTRLQDQARVAAEGQRQQDVADTNHKQALDDAYTTTQRQEQDQQRLLNFRGGQQMIDLQDARKSLDDQHRISTEGMQQNEGLYVSLGKGSATEAQATAYASQAAAIDDARKKADDLYAKQADANTREQDALAKYNAQVMFDLQTEQLAAERKHQDDLKQIDEAAMARHETYNQQLYDLSVEAAARTASHLAITRQEEDEDKARTRGYEDVQFQITAVRTAEQRRWQDEDTRISNSIQDEQNRWTMEKMQRDQIAKEEDDRYATAKLANEQQQQDAEKNITDLGKELSGIDAVIAKVGTLIDKFGEAATAASGIANQPPAPASGAKGAAAPRFATGSRFATAGDAQVNEQGGEMRTLLTGETIIPADETKRMFDALLSARTNVTPISAAPSYHEGNITIQMGDSTVALSASAQARIRQIVQDEVANQQPMTYTARQAATGGLKR